MYRLLGRNTIGMRMTISKSRYLQFIGLVLVFGFALMTWKSPPMYSSIEYCPDEPAANATKPESNCPMSYVLCGARNFEKAHDELDFNRLRSEFHKHVTTIDFQCPSTVRFGRWGGGGYDACLKKTVRPNNRSCLVYSFGICNEWSFDEAWAEYGCEVHSFDPSLGLEDHVHSPNVNFHNLGLWGSDFKNRDGWQLERFSTIRKKLGHEERIIDVLKIDVEGAEWPFLRDVIYSDPAGLSNVRQLYLELHTPKLRYCSDMLAKDFAEINDYVRRLRDDLGFRLYKNLQRNNCCGRFANFMPPGIYERCCHEVFFVNSRLLLKEA